MSPLAWVMLAIVGVGLIGYLIVSSNSLGSVQTNTGGNSLSSIASIFKSSANIFGDVRKAFPSWFDDDKPVTDDELNDYSSSSGFAIH